MLDLKMASTGDESKGKIEQGGSNSRRVMVSSEAEYLRISRNNSAVDHFINGRDQEARETAQEHYYGSSGRVSCESRMSSGQRRNVEPTGNTMQKKGIFFSRDSEIKQGRSGSRSGVDEGRHENSDVTEESISGMSNMKVNTSVGNTRSSDLGYRNGASFNLEEDGELRKQGKEEEVENEVVVGAEDEEEIEEMVVDDVENKERCKELKYLQVYKDEYKNVHNKEIGEFRQSAAQHKEQSEGKENNTGDDALLSDNEDGIRIVEISSDKQKEARFEEGEEAEVEKETIEQEAVEEGERTFVKSENENSDIKKEISYFSGDHLSNSNESFLKNYKDESVHVKEDVEDMEKKKKIQLINKLLYFKNDDGLANHIRNILGSEGKRYVGDNKSINTYRDPSGSVMNSNDDSARKLSEQLNVVKTEPHGDHNNGCGKCMITKDNWMNMKTLCLNYIRILKRLTNEWSETDRAFEYHFANLLNNESANILENYLCCFSNIKIHVAKGVFIDSIIECIEELEIMKRLKLRESKIEQLSSGDIEQNEEKKMSKCEFQKRIIEELDSNLTKEIIEEIHHLNLKNPYCSNYNMSSASVTECENNMQNMYTGMNKHVSFNNECSAYDSKRGQEFNKKNNVGNSFNSMNVCNRSHSNHSCNSHFTNCSNCNANTMDSLIDSSHNHQGSNDNNNSTSYNCMDMSSKMHSGNSNNNSSTTPGNNNLASNCNSSSNMNNGILSRDFFKSCNAVHNNNCMANNGLNTCKKNCSCAEENILNKLNVSIDYNAIADFNSHNYIQEAEKVMERYKCLNKLGTKDNKNNSTYKLCNQSDLVDTNSSSNMHDSSVNSNNKNIIATNNTSNVFKGSSSSSNMNVDANNTDSIINANKNINNNSNNAANVYLHLKNFFIEQENKINRQQKYKEMDSNTNDISLAKFLQIYPNLLSIFDDKSLSELYSESELKELKKKCIKKTLEKIDMSNSKDGERYSSGYKIGDEDLCEDREKSSKVELDPRLLNAQDAAAVGNTSTFCNNPNNNNNNLYQNLIGNTLMNSSGSSSKNMNGNNGSSSINNAIINANLNYLTSNLQKMIKKRKLQETNVGRSSIGGNATPNPSTYDLNYLLMCNPNILKKLKMGLLEGKNIGNATNMNNMNINNGGSIGSGSSNNNNNGNTSGNNNNGGGVGISGDDFRNKNYSFEMNGSDSGSLNSKKALLYRQSILNSLKNMKGAYDQNQETMNVNMSRRNSFNKVGETINPNILFDLLLNKSGNNVNKGAANNVCDNALFSFGNSVANTGNYGNGSFSLMNGSKNGINVNCNMSGNMKKCYDLAAEFNPDLLNGQKTEYSPNVQDLAELAKNHGNQTGMCGTSDGSSVWHMKDIKGEGTKNLKSGKLGFELSHSLSDHMRNDRRNNSSSESSVRSSKGIKGENKLAEKLGTRSGPSNICSNINGGGVSESGAHNSNLTPGTLATTHLAPGSVVNGVVVGKLKYEMPEGVNPNDDKVKGVYFSKSPRGVGKWNAYFQIANNKRLFTSFSVSKYGYNEARNLSILKRTQWEKEYKYQGDVKSGDTGRRGKKKAHGNVSNKNNNMKNANINNVNNNINYNDIVTSGTAYTSENVVTVNNDRNSSLGKTGFKNIGNSESSISNFNRETSRGQMDTKNNKETRGKGMRTRELWKSEDGNENDDTSYYSNGEEDSRPLSKRRNANNSVELFQQVCSNVNKSNNKNVHDNYNNDHVYNRYYRNGENGKLNFEGQNEEAIDECETDNPLKYYRKNSKNDTESFASIDLIRPNLVAETRSR